MAEVGLPEEFTRENTPKATPSEEWTKQLKPIVILLTGKSGAGKSSLCNGILGIEGQVAEEGDFTVRQDGGVTRTVNSYEVTIKKISFCVIDSPGLQDLDYDELSDEQIIGDIKAKLEQKVCGPEGADLVLYCIPMNIHRLEISDAEAMKHLTELLSPDIWKKTVFVLTFANCVRIPPRHRGNEDQYFDKCLTSFKNAISKALVKANCPQDVAENITVVPAGYHAASAQDIYPDDPWKLPCGVNDWFENVWEKCTEKFAEDETLLKWMVSQHSRTVMDKSDVGQTGLTTSTARRKFHLPQSIKKRLQSLWAKVKDMKLSSNDPNYLPPPLVTYFEHFPEYV